jgi:NAD(P)-dependent dehydrogenase (short-subunit alcohol dehydrogenase family)
MTTAVVIGASGGIGRALVGEIARRGTHDRIFALSRQSIPVAGPGVIAGRIDLNDEATVAQAAAEAGEADLVLVATGVLQSASLRPERSYRALDGDAMLESFRINTVGPSLAAKHFLPRLPRDRRGVFAALSARVGSISDNHLGGWHSYRASKAALNMILANLAIELVRERPLSLCVGLHPGTVDTRLSAPFQRNLASSQLFSPDYSATCLLDVVARLTPADSGGIYAWDGSRIAP